MQPLLLALVFDEAENLRGFVPDVASCLKVRGCAQPETSAPAHCSPKSAGAQGGARHSHPIAFLPCSSSTSCLPCSFKHVALYLSLATEIHPLKPGQKWQNARRTPCDEHLNTPGCMAREQVCLKPSSLHLALACLVSPDPLLH